MKDTEFLYATMRVRVNENNLLSPQAIERMADAKTPEEAAKIMSDAGYTDVSPRSFKDIERSLSEMRKSVMEFIREISPCPEICEVFALKYDFHNIKTIIKAAFTGTDAERLLSDSSYIPKEKLVSSIVGGDMSELPEIMRNAIISAKETLAHTRDPQLSDFLLDRAYFKMIKSAAEKSGSEFLKGYVRLLIDVANLRSAVRNLRQGRSGEVLEASLSEGGNIPAAVFKAYDFEGGFSSSPLADAAKLGADAAAGKTGLTAFEKELDVVLIKYMQSAKYASFDERPLIAYIAARDAEAMSIRIIMAGKLEGLSGDEIRSRLRV